MSFWKWSRTWHQVWSAGTGRSRLRPYNQQRVQRNLQKCIMAGARDEMRAECPRLINCRRLPFLPESTFCGRASCRFCRDVNGETVAVADSAGIRASETQAVQDAGCRFCRNAHPLVIALLHCSGATGRTATAATRHSVACAGASGHGQLRSAPVKSGQEVQNCGDEGLGPQEEEDVTAGEGGHL